MTGLLLGAALLFAPISAADPQDLEPYCSSGQVPTAGQCKPLPGQTQVNEAPGANPDVPVGLDPESVPAV